MEKNIYTFTLDDDEYPSMAVVNNIKFIARYVYEEIFNSCDYEEILEESRQSNKLHVNELYDIKVRDGYIYLFDSEKKKDDYRFYNPVMLSNRTFCITLTGEDIGIDNVYKILNDSLRLMGFSYKFKINKYSYYTKDLNDETGRCELLDEITSKKNNNKKKAVKVKKLMPSFTLSKVLGR